MLRDYAKAVGISLDVVALEPPALFERLEACNYDAVYMRALMSDPIGLSLDYWLSSGDAHLWNMASKTPATEWEKEIDRLMTEQASTIEMARRKTIFNDVQRIFAENLPVLYFAAPRLYAHSVRLRRGAVGDAAAGAVERGLAERHGRSRRETLMARFLVRRVIFAVLLVFISSSAALFLTRAGARRSHDRAGAESVARGGGGGARFDLDRPALEQWGLWMSRAVRFDFGESLQ